MDPLRFTSPLWCHALTLAERNAILAGNPTSDFPQDKNIELGRRRLGRWQAQAPFSIESYLAQRLAVDGITQERLLSILSEPVETFHNLLPDMPAWLVQLREAFAQSQQFFGDAPLEELLPDGADNEDKTPDEELLGFLRLVEPLIDQACQRIQATIADLGNQWHRLPFDPDTIEDILLMNLEEPLLMRLSRTLVLELHVARLQGNLDGNTPKERFESFIQRLSQHELALAILTEYPVLARQLTLCINQWTEVCLEFLNRLCLDWDIIRCRFCPDHEPGALVEVAGGAGDTHRGGRSVMIATFESGFQIVYKPKSLKIDEHFQDLLTWLNDRGCEPRLQLMTVVDRGDYGWVEFVAYQTCGTLEELSRFFQRHGAYLALLYVLNSNDFHYENIIAVGEHPLLIDLETLLQPSFDIFDEMQAEFAAEKVMAQSVLQVGLLPVRMWSNDDYAGIDISGLGGMAGQLTPDRLPQITDAGTDAMRFVRERIEIAGDANRPSLNGVEISATQHVEDIVAGFVTIYRLLMSHRDELLADEGPLARFSQDEIRVLLRPTRTYDQLLTESFHPDLLRDALERDLFLDRLWMAAPIRSYLARVIASEQADLQRGDIPIFTTTPTSLELYGMGSEGIGGVLYESGMKAVHHRIGLLSDQDLQRQMWFIRASIATLEPGNVMPPTGSDKTTNRTGSVSNTRLISSAKAIADHLAATAIFGAEDVTWIGMELMDQQSWAIRTLGVDLYGGISGIALFLAYAGEIVGDGSYILLARRTLKTIVGQMELLQTEMTEIGGFEGWGSVVYTLTNLAILWGDQGILYQARGIVEIIANLVEQDDRFDIGRGSAGAIITLLTLHRTISHDRAVDVAMACGDHLLASATPTQQGLSWNIPSIGARPTSDLLHGNLGIAWALLELAKETGMERYAAAAQQAIDYENSLLATNIENHHDLHESNLSGALGFAFARLCVLQHVKNSELSGQVREVIQSVLSHDYEGTHSLYNGEMGKFDLLRQASHILNEDQYRAQAETIGATVVENIELDGWQCSGPKCVELPSLMFGLAGIGYAMLGLARPDRVPSILMLAPPIPQHAFS